MAGIKRKISEVEDVETQPLPSVRDLASSEASIRRIALQNIEKHLQSRSSKSRLTQVQTEQLWRGFHVLLYMHDSKNAISVQNLTLQLVKTFRVMRAKDEQIEAESATSLDQNGTDGIAGATTNSVADAAEDDEFGGFGSDDGDDNDNTEKEDDIPSETDIDNSWLSKYSLAFWNTMIREWSTIDSHRMNKYLYLVRLAVCELFTICFETAVQTNISPATPSTSKSPSAAISSRQDAKATQPKTKNRSKSKIKSEQQSSEEKPKTPRDKDTAAAATTHTPTQSNLKTLLKSQLAILTNYPLHPRNSRIPAGLRLHILDLYNDELAKAANTATNSAGWNANGNGNLQGNTSGAVQKGVQDAKDMLRTPVGILAKRAMDKRVRMKAREALEEFDSLT